MRINDIEPVCQLDAILWLFGVSNGLNPCYTNKEFRDESAAKTTVVNFDSSPLSIFPKEYI